MFHQIRNLYRPLAAFALTAATAVPIAAQDFAVGVQQDPGAGTAIYDFQFNGPPAGQAIVAVGTLGIQFPIPPLGNLYLNLMAPIGFLPPVPLDATGQGRLRVVLPLTDNNMTICFQTIFVDPLNNWRLSWSWHSVVNAAVPNTPFGYLFDHNGATNMLNTFVRGRPGTTVTLRIRRGNQLIMERIVPIGPGGTGTGAIGVDVSPGDRWSVVYTDTAGGLGIGRSGTF